MADRQEQEGESHCLMFQAGNPTILSVLTHPASLVLGTSRPSSPGLLGSIFSTLLPQVWSWLQQPPHPRVLAEDAASAPAAKWCTLESACEHAVPGDS